MRTTILLAALLAAAPCWAQQMNKCPGPDGTTVYSDKPCPGSAGRHQAPAQVVDALRFSGDAMSDLIKISALADNMRTLGRDCEWALKVDRRKSSVCRVFLDKLNPRGELGAISVRLQEVRSAGSMPREQAEEVARITRLLRDVLRHREFVVANMANGSN